MPILTSLSGYARNLALRIYLWNLTAVTFFKSVRDTTMERVAFLIPGRPAVDQAAHSSSNTFSPLIDGQIQVHPETGRPAQLWDKLKVKQKVKKKKPMPPDTPIDPDKVRFVCLSDTHNRAGGVLDHVPHGDVLLHAGDFTMVGLPQQVEEFNNFLGNLPHRYKVIIAGNHDLSFDPELLEDESAMRKFGYTPDTIHRYMEEKGIEQMKDVLTNCTHYLEDSETQICGIRIHGSPWQPWFHDWGFNLERGQPCLDKWNLIAEGVDVLITHGPPLGHGDLCSDGNRAGCTELLHTIQHRVKPKYHVFGHIHEGYGITTDGATDYINASTCTLRYKPANPPIIFDVPLPDGCSKEDFLQGAPLASDPPGQAQAESMIVDD